MIPSAFKALCADIRRTWTPENGLVAILRPAYERPEPLRLCVGPVTNVGMIAEDCVVWKGDSQVYNGKIENESLKRLLTGEGICRCVLTNVRQMDTKARPKMACYGNPTVCRGKLCPMKRKRKC